MHDAAARARAGVLVEGDHVVTARCLDMNAAFFPEVCLDAEHLPIEPQRLQPTSRTARAMCVRP